MGTYIIKDTYEMLQDVWRQREKRVNMERFDIRGKDWGLMERQDGLGAFTWAEEALAYRKSFWSSFFVNVMMVVVCTLLSAYLVLHKHDPVPVSKSAISTEEYGATVQEQRRLQTELATANKKIADLKSKDALMAAMVKTQNVVVKQREQQLKDLHASVPSQPIILEAIRKEASTPAELQAAVERNFGKFTIKVIGE